DKIWAMCDEMIEAHQSDGFLGEFKPVIKNTGKPLSSVERVFLTIEPDGVPFFGGATQAGFQLVAENSSGKPFCGEVAIKANGGEVTFSPANVLKVEVNAG